MRFSAKFVSCALCLILFAFSQAKADEAAVVSAEKKSIEETCGNPVNYNSGFLSKADFNGDGVPDLVFDYAETSCSAFCGTAGCTVSIYLSQGGEYKQAFSDNLRSWKAKRRGGKDLLQTSLHGGACGKAGAYECVKTFAWNGKRFAPIR